jgi:hypothetical protein
VNLLDTSPDRVRAAEIQCLQMGAEQLAAYALKHGLALNMKVEPQQPPVITVREARNGAA